MEHGVVVFGYLWRLLFWEENVEWRWWLGEVKKKINRVESIEEGRTFKKALALLASGSRWNLDGNFD